MDEPTEASAAVKLRWLLRRFPHLRDQDHTFSILDYGCGCATLLRLMAEAGMLATLIGCDLTPANLQEAFRRWPRSLRAPELHCHGIRTALADRSIDFLVINMMLHQVPLRFRNTVYTETRRLLRPGGQLVLFEHNPLTRRIVDDSDLVHPSDVRVSLKTLGFNDIQVEYLMFLPPRLVIAPVERAVRWLPLGAQYGVAARRRNHTRWRDPVPIEMT